MRSFAKSLSKVMGICYNCMWPWCSFFIALTLEPIVGGTSYKGAGPQKKMSTYLGSII